jgi:hypothetical protein
MATLKDFLHLGDGLNQAAISGFQIEHHAWAPPSLRANICGSNFRVNPVRREQVRIEARRLQSRAENLLPESKCSACGRQHDHAYGQVWGAGLSVTTSAFACMLESVFSARMPAKLKMPLCKLLPRGNLTSIRDS